MMRERAVRFDPPSSASASRCRTATQKSNSQVNTTHLAIDRNTGIRTLKMTTRSAVRLQSLAVWMPIGRIQAKASRLKNLSNQSRLSCWE